MRTGFLTDKTNGSLFCVLLAAVGILLFRRYDAFTHPQLWAEDGPIFLQQYYEIGWATLFTSYAGYLHTAERLIVLCWGNLDLLYLPTAYNITVLLLYCWLIIYLWKSAVLLGLRHKSLYALMFLVIPITSDVYMNVTNLNGIISLALINFLITRHVPPGTARYIGFLLLLVIISLSGPTSIILCPVIFLFLFIRRRDLAPKVTLALALIFLCGTLQLYLVMFAGNDFHRGLNSVHESYHLGRMITSNVADLFFLQDGPLSVIPHSIQVVICMFLFVLMLWLFAKIYIKLKDSAKHLLLSIAILYMASTIITYWPAESQLLAMRNFSRYFVVPYVCILWIVLLALDKKINNIHILIYGAFILAHTRLIRFSLIDKHWKQQIIEYRAGKREAIDINPNGWTFKLPSPR